MLTGPRALLFPALLVTLLAGANVAAGADREAPPVPKLRPAQDLVGPLGIEVVDRRRGPSGASLPSQQLGYRRTAGFPGGQWAAWTIDRPVAEWLLDGAIVGAAAGGVRLVGQAGGPSRLVIDRFFCDGAPGLPPTCFVRMRLEWDMGEGFEELWTLDDTVPWGDGLTLEYEVPEQIALEMARGVARAMEDAFPQVEEEAWDEGGESRELAARMLAADEGELDEMELAALRAEADRLILVDDRDREWRPVGDEVWDAPRLYMVRVGEPTVRLRIPEVLRALEDQRLDRYYGYLVEETRAKARAGGVAVGVGAGLLFSGILLGAASSGGDNPAPGLAGFMLGIGGAASLGVGIPVLAGKQRRLRKLESTKRMNYFLDLRELREAMERHQP
ncbi:MAG: hypothetical protein KDA24_18455 [Deltaproteobacteria bacterium]|nr:hypothetical protein [Deltaproteobacteria bacterium]